MQGGRELLASSKMCSTGHWKGLELGAKTQVAVLVTTLHAFEACLEEGQSCDWQVINEMVCNMISSWRIEVTWVKGAIIGRSS